MTSLQYLTSHYPILTHLSQYLSTLDLLHLGLTCRTLHSYILSSPPIFKLLQRTALCDGHGLRDRQNFEGAYHKHPHEYKIQADEPIEVRLWATKCDEAGALPCLKCGINVCEECRRYPREQLSDKLLRRPHLNAPYQSENVFCMCSPCDSALETSLNGQYLNELCDCDTFKRWICSKCVRAEHVETAAMYRRNSVGETWDYDRFEELYGKTRMVQDHQFQLLFLCPCGAYVPDEMRLRCTWCRRRHCPQSEWRHEATEVKAGPAMIYEDPCYPPFIDDRYTGVADKPYPKLAYEGPIWQVLE